MKEFCQNPATFSGIKPVPVSETITSIGEKSNDYPMAR